MVEHQPGLTLLTHVVLVLGIAVVALPIYVTFVASTSIWPVGMKPTSVISGGGGHSSLQT